MEFLILLAMMLPAWFLYHVGFWRWRQSLPKDAPERRWVTAQWHYYWNKPKEYWIPLPLLYVVAIWSVVVFLPLIFLMSR